MRLPAPVIGVLMDMSRPERPIELTVDLRYNRVSGPDRFEATFEMDPYRRQMLLEGTDEISETLRHELKIAAFERRVDALGRVS